ncbi:MAG: molybdopterin molybdotransferase [Actinomycetota bacterium]|nr:molybdopterin molybdotransferase [Actinomycetota bacterium]
MISLDEAQAHVFATCRPLEPADVALAEARGLVLAADVVAPEAVPPFANTAMDGYAVRTADTAGASEDTPVRLRVVDDLAAGRAPTRAVGPGEAIRIMTGAPVPDGADAIVMVERTRADGDDVLVHAAAQSGDHVRAIGGDVTRGQVVFERGTSLTPAHLGVLASLDVERARVYRRARVGVISTGDELVEHGPLQPGQIRDSNRPMLLALVAEAGCEPVNLGIARDDEDVITERITHAVDTCDALLTSGGVSMGDYDYVKAVLERLAKERPGSAFVWWQVAIKPAKPFAFGTLGDVPVFGLPGNPVSSHVSFELFARPALRQMMGYRDGRRSEVLAQAAEPMRRRPDGKLHLDRVRVWYDGDGYRCERSGGQASNALSAMANANGLALLPDGDGVDAGDAVRVLLLG